MKYPKLFEPSSIDGIPLRNRVIMAPMGSNFACEDGQMTDLQLQHYELRAKGGVGLIVTESSPVDPLGRHGKRRIQIYRDEAVGELKVLTERVHRHGAKILLQLTHAGRKCSPEVIGEYPVAPSSIPLPNRSDMPRSLSVDEIRDIVKKFGEGACKAREAGFDGVLLLGASGHLIHQFLSPVSNRRMDAYGGTVENRMRFLLEIIDEIKEVTKGEIPVSVKLLGKEPGNAEGTAVSLEDIRRVAEAITKRGVASIHLSTNMTLNPEIELQELVKLAKEIKKQQPVNISLAGGIHSPKFAEMILSSGAVDFIEMGRAILADPEFCNKAMNQQEADIRPCLNCNLCRYKTSQKEEIECTVNPFLGVLNDGDHRLLSGTDKPIVIIGGGPAGMQAAVSLSDMGYAGVIYEMNDSLGGQLLSASAPPHKERIFEYIDYLVEQVKKTSFKVFLNTEINESTMHLLDEVSLEAVVVATGASPYYPDYVDPSSSYVCTAMDVLLNKVEFQNKNIVILGGGQVACEVADYMTEPEHKNKVAILCSSKQIAKNVIEVERKPLLKRLGSKNVRMLVNAVPTAVVGGIVTYQHSGNTEMMVADHVIIAKGWKSVNNMVEKLKNENYKVYVIGDALSPRSILEAVKEAVDLSGVLMDA